MKVHSLITGVFLVLVTGTIFIYSKANRLERERSTVWQAGYMEGIHRGLQASEDQVTQILQSGTLNREAMRAFVLTGQTNNPYGPAPIMYGWGPGFQQLRQ